MNELMKLKGNILLSQGNITDKIQNMLNEETKITNEIDSLVYKAYNLSAKEVDTIERGNS